MSPDDPAFRSFNKNDVMLEAVYRKMVPHPAFAGYDFPQYGVFLFRQETGFPEQDGSAKYQIFQVQLRRSGGFDYGYIVLDELIPGTDMGMQRIRRMTTYRLRSISKPIPIPIPENGWCNEPGNWIYMSEHPRNFNSCVI
jgi:hypothetical protein